MADISRLITQYRQEAGLTRKELAYKSGLSETKIALFEDSSYHFSKLLTLEKIASALGKRIEIKLVEISPDSP